MLCALLALACTGPADTGSSNPTVDTGSPACEAHTNGDDPNLDALLAVLEGFASKDPGDGRPSGLSVGVVVDGVLVSVAGVGTQGKEGHPRAELPADAHTVYTIASTSKWVATAAAMTLVDDGLLDSHAPITEALPDYTESQGRHDAITVHHLLRMVSGLRNDGGCYLYSHSALDTPTGCAAFTAGPGTVLEELFAPEVLATSPYDGSLGVYNITAGEPGAAAWHYSNWGIMLAGRALEVAAGAAYPDLVRERVFEPLCMETATFSASDVEATDDYAIGAGAASVDGYCPEPELGHDSLAPFYLDELACPARDPNGGARASAVDMGRFAQALLADSEGLARMLCPEGGGPGDACEGRVPTGGSYWGDTYGYTNFHHRYGGLDVYTHGGGRAGYGAVFWLVPEAGFAVVILGNDDSIASDLVPAAEWAMDCYLLELGCD